MLRLRPLRPDDQPLIWEALHVALWDPPPAALRPREVLEEPRIRIYAEDWGRAGDTGVAAELEGEAAPIGACWMRLVPEKQGLAYVDEQTPQLGIALFPLFQYRGYGQPLLEGALKQARRVGFRQVALTVHPENPAIRLYERCGFRNAGLRGTYHLMVVSL